MVIRIKDAKVKSMVDTETKKLRVVQLDSKEEGVSLTLEVPEALSNKIEESGTLDVVIDSKPITRGSKALLYLEGKVFRQHDDKEFEAVATMGGLRLVVKMKKATPTKKKTFDSETVFLSLS